MTELQSKIVEFLGSTEAGFLTTYTALGFAFSTTGRGIASSMWGLGAEGVPWWRVVGKNGELNGRDSVEQRRLLEAEGHAFKADFRVVL